MSEGQPITVFATIDAPAADLAQVLAAVADLVRLTSAEPGCLRYDVHQSATEPGRLIIHEAWTDTAALDLHRASAHVAAFKAALAGTTASAWASPFDRLPDAGHRPQADADATEPAHTRLEQGIRVPQ